MNWGSWAVQAESVIINPSRLPPARFVYEIISATTTVLRNRSASMAGHERELTCSMVTDSRRG